MFSSNGLLKTKTIWYLQLLETHLSPQERERNDFVGRLEILSPISKLAISNYQQDVI